MREEWQLSFLYFNVHDDGHVNGHDDHGRDVNDRDENDNDLRFHFFISHDHDHVYSYHHAYVFFQLLFSNFFVLYEPYDHAYNLGHAYFLQIHVNC